MILICCLPYFISFAAFKINGRNVKWRSKSPGKREHIVVDTLDVSWAAQTGKHLLRTQNVSEQNLCPGQNLCPQQMLRARANGETFLSATMCPQQCVLVYQGLKSLLKFRVGLVIIRDKFALKT